MAQRQHSEKGGLQGTAQLGFPGKDRSGESLAGDSLSTCDQQGNSGGRLGLLDVSCTQRVPYPDAGSHTEA